MPPEMDLTTATNPAKNTADEASAVFGTTTSPAPQKAPPKTSPDVPPDATPAAPPEAPQVALQRTDASHAGPGEALEGALASTAGPVPVPSSVGMPPRHADYLPPIARAFALLFLARDLRVSAAQLVATLGNNAPTLEACRRAAHELGARTTLLHRPLLETLSPLALPCLLLLSNDRACVLLGYADNGNARILLPEYGADEQQLPTGDLERDYTGYVLFASMTARADRHLRPLAKAAERRWFWDVIQHFAPLYRQVAVLGVAVNVFVLIGPLFIMNVYDRVVPNLAYETLWVLGVGAMAGYGLDLALRSLRGYFTERAGRNIDTIIATRVMRQILGMRLEDRPASSGALMNHLREFDGLRELFSSGTLLVFADLPFAVLFLAMVAWLGGVLAVIPLVGMLVLLVFVLGMQQAAKRGARVQHYGQVEKNAHLVEMVTGLEAIKMASAENRMLQIWEKLAGHCAAMSEESKRLSGHVVNLSLFATHLVSVFLIVAGVYLIGDNVLTVGGLIACNILTGRIMSSIVQAAALTTRFQQARLSLQQLDTFMTLPQERACQAGTDFGRLSHDIDFKQVSFTYPGMPLPAIRNLSLSIPAGRHLGIMGGMGSGKSTLGKLLAGLYTPGEGSVCFGGVDLRQLDVVDLRTRLGYMPQEPMLFHGTVRDNIALGAPHAPDNLILRAAWLAGVTDFIRLHPAGFGMEVGERGQNLSGGQRQAISLARALLHDPDVIILDEPTSNMDGATELLLKQRLRTVLEGKTLILNLHRTSLLTLVDTLLVLRDGQVAAYGPRDAVLKHLHNQQVA